MFPEYFYNLNNAMFAADYPNMFMDKNQFVLSAVPKDLGKDVLVALSDVRKVYAPYMTAEEGGDKAVIRYKGKTVELTAGSNIINVDGISIEMDYPVQKADEKIWVPVGALMRASVTSGSRSNSQSSLR